ncbi:MAG: hypothetical protein ACFFDH_14590 [Promethearchaeota archaeon]
MSEEEKFNSIIQEIKDIYLYLTQGEPTPDDEITAREKFINQIQTLKTIKSFNVEANTSLFEDTLHKLDDWDTLELWFIESELPDYIQKIINITDEVPEFQPVKEIEESPAAQIHENLEKASFDIDKIVDKVSEQFKGEINDLKQEIDVLKLELEKKDETLKKVSQNKVIKKITPKKDVKLPPPKIKIPVTTKPEKAPQIKAPSKIEAEIPKVKVGVKSIKDVQSKIEEELEKLSTPSTIKQKIEQELQTLGESENIIEKQGHNKISELPQKPKTVLKMLEESRTLSKTSEFTEMPEKPKKDSLISEVIEIEASEKETEVPFTVKEPKVIEEPEITSKPKITSVSVEEIEAESIQSTGTELFNVFSSVGEKTTQPLPTLNEAFHSLEVKEKKKKDEKKKKKESKKEVNKPDTIPFIEFNASKPEVKENDEVEPFTEEELPSDKDSLYQELIALEGKRYSLEKNFKEIEKIYTSGSIDDFEYKKQSDDLRVKLDKITSKINRIRRVISSL